MLRYKLQINIGYLHSTPKLTIARRRNNRREKQTRFIMDLVLYTFYDRFGILYLIDQALPGHFFKKLQLLWLSLNEGFFPTQLRVPKDHAVRTFDKMEYRDCEMTRESRQIQLFQQA